MLLPKGIEKHKNLSTSFTRFDHLLQDLAENRFSGYIRLNFWGYEGVLVLDTGRMIEAYAADKDMHLTSEQAVLSIFSKSLQPDGSIEVYDLSSEVALALGYAMQSSRYKDDSSLGNYSLGQVFDLLERESVTGYVDIQFTEQKGIGTVYYLEGISVEAVIKSSSGKVASGEQVFAKFLELGEIIQPYVVVHRATNPQTIVEDRVFVIPWQHEKYLKFWNELLQYLRNITIDQFRKDRFYSNFQQIGLELIDHYPFLDPKNDIVELTETEFKVKRLIYHPAFLQGMTIVLNKMLRQVPVRRLRKLDMKKVAADVRAFAKKNEVAPSQLDTDQLVRQIFRGFTEI